MWEFEFPKLKFTCLFYMWFKFIEWMMGASHIELECHLWSLFAFWGVAQATRDSLFL